ncbi:hypothetical protein LZ30DRAFT_779047 [Colletotrichum cereale]|nr:hypothetical protein LZ30DRAFT_779047 [Colletotrichum cereale]
MSEWTTRQAGPWTLQRNGARLAARRGGYTRHLSSLSASFCYVLYGGYLGPDRERAQAEAVRVYENHNKTVKELIPPEKLLVINLEDGLGWEDICAFLGHDVPDAPYPRVNEAEEFQTMVMEDMLASWKRTALKVAGVLVPVIGASVWVWRR